VIDHADVGWGEVGRAPAGGDVLGGDAGFADHRRGEIGTAIDGADGLLNESPRSA
jgi:hypothetical protein